MINKIFSFFAITSFITAIFTGNMDNLCLSIINGTAKSVSVTISLLGMMVLWCGIMSVFKESGILSILSRIIRPIFKKIFPESFKKNVATEEITACVSANILGISNAATPLALKAMRALDKQNNSDKASADMITLCIIGCSCFNIIPTTLLSLRAQHNAEIIYEIIPPVWICSFLCMFLGICITRAFSKSYEHY